MISQNYFDLFQTSLYFFSSLLQADAALLGFGTVFIIYKLQSLENIRQSIIQTYYSKGSTYTDHMNSLILSKNPIDIAKTLVGMKASEYHYRNYEYVVLIPAKSEEIKNSIKVPVVVIALHAVFCAIFLFIAQFVYKSFEWQLILLFITLLWFAWLVFLASRLAISLLTGTDTYEISQLLPEVDKAMKTIIEENRNKNPKS